MKMPSLGDLNSFNPGSTHRWLVHIEGLSVDGLTTGYIPCTSVNENVGGVAYYTFRAGVEDFQIPQGFNRPSIDITFIDDDNYTLSKLFNAWNQDIFNIKDGSMGDLELNAKKLTIFRYDNQNEIDANMQSEYKVLPIQGANFIGGNSPQFLVNTMGFTVMEVLKSTTLPS